MPDGEALRRTEWYGGARWCRTRTRLVRPCRPLTVLHTVNKQRLLLVRLISVLLLVEALDGELRLRRIVQLVVQVLDKLLLHRAAGPDTATQPSEVTVTDPDGRADVFDAPETA